MLSLTLIFSRQPTTPSPTPSPVKAATGKKRAIGTCESDGDDVFVPRYFYFHVPLMSNLLTTFLLQPYT